MKPELPDWSEDWHVLVAGHGSVALYWGFRCGHRIAGRSKGDRKVSRKYSLKFPREKRKKKQETSEGGKRERINEIEWNRVLVETGDRKYKKYGRKIKKPEKKTRN